MFFYLLNSQAPEIKMYNILFFKRVSETFWKKENGILLKKAQNKAYLNVNNFSLNQILTLQNHWG